MRAPSWLTCRLSARKRPDAGRRDGRRGASRRKQLARAVLGRARRQHRLPCRTRATEDSTPVSDALVAVTGATGHVGGNLVRALLARGRKVRALVLAQERLPTLDGLDVERVVGEIGVPRSLIRAFDGVEVVNRLAGYISIMPGDEPLLQAINVEGVRDVVAACVDRHVKRLVHFSSIHALSP